MVIKRGGLGCFQRAVNHLKRGVDFVHHRKAGRQLRPEGIRHYSDGRKHLQPVKIRLAEIRTTEMLKEDLDDVVLGHILNRNARRFHPCDWMPESKALKAKAASCGGERCDHHWVSFYEMD